MALTIDSLASSLSGYLATDQVNSVRRAYFYADSRNASQGTSIRTLTVV